MRTVVDAAWWALHGAFLDASTAELRAACPAIEVFDQV
jgi:hypothetical protein